MATHMILPRLLLLGIIVIVYATIECLGKKGGYFYFQFLCYENPGHFDILGNMCDSLPSKNCDPYFLICISNKPIKEISISNCPIFHLKTKPYDNAEYICNFPYDNRDILQAFPIIELPYPLQEKYYVRILVKDSNQFSIDQDIADFSTIFNGSPSSNYNKFVSTEIFMTRTEPKIGNPKAKIKIAIALKCDWNLYGNLCIKFCKSINTDNYVCSSEGDKVCTTGWIGTDCQQKDLCKTLGCVQGASCVYLNSVPKCFCNGVIGQQCYNNFNPCFPNPCRNEGKCVRLSFQSDQVICNCQAPYYGYQCRLRFNLCQLDPCKNNGTCIMIKNNKRLCKCLPNFKGRYCEDINVTTMKQERIINTNNTIVQEVSSDFQKKKNSHFEVLFSILSAMCILTAVIIGVYFFIIWKKKRKGFRMKESKCIKNIINEDPISNVQHYYGFIKDELIYETIDERETYVYQIENNDDYLVPSRPTTPIVTPCHMTNNSNCNTLSSSYDISNDDKITNMNTKDNEYMPELPTRTPTKKHFQIFHHFKF